MAEQKSTTCRIDGCGPSRHHLERGLCPKHYQRWRHTGTTDRAPRRIIPLEQRFWSKVAAPDGPLGCRHWMNALNACQYGTFGLMRGVRTVLAHRLAWTLTFHGPYRPDDHFRHLCNNPPCCNPFHIVPGTLQQNRDDCVLADRHARGERHSSAKLTDADIPVIRASNEPVSILAARYGVKKTAIVCVRSRKTWAHVL